MNLRELLISTMDQLTTKCVGLVVDHDGFAMKLVPQAEGEGWLAFTIVDGEEINGDASTVPRALATCADEARREMRARRALRPPPPYDALERAGFAFADAAVECLSHGFDESVWHAMNAALGRREQGDRWAASRGHHWCPSGKFTPHGATCKCSRGDGWVGAKFVQEVNAVSLAVEKISSKTEQR